MTASLQESNFAAKFFGEFYGSIHVYYFIILGMDNMRM